MLQQLLSQRALPPLQPREQMLAVLQSEIYGKLPEKPQELSFSVQDDFIPIFCAGKAVCQKVTAHGLIDGREFSFPFYAALPTDGKLHPFFVHINFRPDTPDRYQPTEELIDTGFAVLSFCYEDVTADNGDFTDGLAGVLCPDGVRRADGAGKIAMWAWAAQRVLDYALTLGELLDPRQAVVCGHSRLGKTALFAAATDERFTHAYSNDSGCSGAALSREKQGETVRRICEVFPFWFCENYRKYADREHEMPFDQHWLAACVAPRKLLIGSASEDAWADPISEFLCCVAAGPAFEKGFCSPDRLPEVGEILLEGDVGYHLRKGLHYFSREDWQRLMAFVRLHN
ncbi:MAG: acetylxylan esterase [Clostridia bacterium]|nr:acetylxylan esterase [Clostridia bacterium]